MAKAFWIAHVTVTDPEKYKDYVEGSAIAFKKFGARIIARGGKFEQLEGNGRPRNVVIEFPTYQAAFDCYRSDEYQVAKAKRQGAGIADVVIVEAVE
jgi:uncharacterized protein (DUF1330 family)